MITIDAVRDHTLTNSNTLYCKYHSHLLDIKFSEVSWDEIASVFRNASSCELKQEWLKQTEARFRPAHVNVAWTSEAFWVLASLRDDDVFNAATQLNQQTCDLGDVFEIFLWDQQGQNYFELHVTPENQKLQLRIKRDDSVLLDESQIIFLQDEDVFQSRTHLWPEGNGWSVLAVVPSTLITNGQELDASMCWRFSFSRYDFTRGLSEPVLSSTSAHTLPDFHQRHEWKRMAFVR